MKFFLLKRRACIADDVVRCGSLVFFCCGRGGRVADARLLLADAWRTRGGRAIQFAISLMVPPLNMSSIPNSISLSISFEFTSDSTFDSIFDFTFAFTFDFTSSYTFRIGGSPLD